MANKGTEVMNPDKPGALAPYAEFLMNQEVKELLADNIGNGGIDQFSLTRVKVPAGGGIAWAVPTLEGVSVAQEFTGVIVHWKTMRAYWAEAYGTGSGDTPPDCSSQDGDIGIGEPGGECMKCPLNEFGTAHTGRGKACKEVRGLFVLPENALFPTFMPLPPMSIAPLKSYMLQLASSGINYWKVVTALTLETARNKDNVVYSRAVPKLVRRLEDAEVVAVKAYRDELRPAIEGVVLSRADVDGPSDQPGEAAPVDDQPGE